MLKQAYHTVQPRSGTAYPNSDPSRTASQRTSLLTLAQWLPQIPAWTREVARACGCQKNGAPLIHLCMLVPRHRFGASLFNTPLLLVLRFFYQACSFDLSKSRAGSRHIHPGKYQCQPDDVPLARKVASKTYELQKRPNVPNVFAQSEVFSTTDWSDKLSASLSIYQNHEVVSITWVKALASPLSHEFIQFVIEDMKNGARNRVIVDRYEDGDWVIVGWNWASKKIPFDRHSLPLPLVSLTYEDAQSRPSVSSVANMLADVTARRPSYNIMKEMCWWYAEAVFETAHTKFGGTLKEWKWARFRYSFIVRTSVFPRETLASEAEQFEKQNVEEMMY